MNEQLQAAYQEGYDKRAAEEKTQEDAKLQDAYNRGYAQRDADEKPMAQQKLQDAYLDGYNKRKQEDDSTQHVVQDEFAQLRLELRSQGAAQHIRTFSGENSDKYHDWLRDMEKTITLLGNDDARARILVLQSLSGPASDFVVREIAKNNDITWKKLKEKLDGRYNDMSDIAYAKQKLRKLVQGRSESVQNFCERLMTTAKSAYNEDKLRNEFVQQQLVEYFTDGLLEDNAVKRIVRKKPATLEEALGIATEEQQVQRSFELRRGQDPSAEHTPMEVDAISSGNKDELTEMKNMMQEILRSHQEDHAARTRIPINQAAHPQPPQQMNNRRPYPSTLTDTRRCYKCQRIGHISANCRTPSAPTSLPHRDNRGRFIDNPRNADLECYRCHRKGHIAVNCRVRLTTPREDRNPVRTPYNANVECYRCHGRGHYANSCMNYPGRNQPAYINVLGPHQPFPMDTRGAGHQFAETPTYAQVLTHPAGWFTSHHQPKNE